MPQSLKLRDSWIMDYMGQYLQPPAEAYRLNLEAELMLNMELLLLIKKHKLTRPDKSDHQLIIFLIRIIDRVKLSSELEQLPTGTKVDEIIETSDHKSELFRFVNSYLINHLNTKEYWRFRSFKTA